MILILKKEPYIIPEEDLQNQIIADSYENIKLIVESITSEKGRAIGGLLVLQLLIKTICPHQSIRLHKSNSSSSKNVFSWKKGLPMRNIDKNYITPILRKYNLIRLNADGFMMTRSLAENYPYTTLYKAKLKGAREQWFNLIELIEKNKIDAFSMLKILISFLIQRNIDFNKLVNKVLLRTVDFVKKKDSKAIFFVIQRHLFDSEYHARIFEIIIHSFFQALEFSSSDFRDLYKLSNLQQMRSANKKHGNIGDIELLNTNNVDLILEAWDTKYGKNYLFDELCEAKEKLKFHPEINIFGFITSEKPIISKEILEKLESFDLDGVEAIIIEFKDFINMKLNKFNQNNEEFWKIWFKRYVETLCRKREEIAPIDEPTYGFLNELLTFMD